MTLASDLQPVLDGARTLIADLGFRVRSVIIRTTTRAGAGLAAIGTETHSDLTLDPRPRVRQVTRAESRPGGLHQAGDLTVSRISKLYTRSQLDPAGNVVWLVGGEPCTLVSLDERPLEWVATVRRTDR